MRVTLTRRAKAERNHALAQRGDAAAAARLLEHFDAAERRLRRFPELGREGRAAGTRELIIAATPYTLVYRIEQDRVTILEIRHSSRSR